MARQLFIEMTEEFPTLWDDLNLEIDERKNTWIDYTLYHVS